MRTLSIDYEGEPLDDDLFEALVGLLADHGRHPEACWDGPSDDFQERHAS